MARTAQPTPPTRAVAYLRVSTEKQVDHGVSLDAQRAKVTAYAALYDLEIVAFEVDAGASAKTLDRPALTRALAMLDGGDADAILVVKLDRLTRSVRDLGELVDRCQRGGWAVLSVSEQIDTRSAAGRLVLNVLASVAQWERETVGERTSAAMAHKRACGEYTGGEPPYGFQVSADGRALAAHPGEQRVIRAARELRAAGLSLRRIGAALEVEGLLPRTAPRWHAETVKAVLASEVA